MKKKVLATGLIAAVISSSAFAGSTSINVPVTIDYSDGCVLDVPGVVDLGTVAGVQITDNIVYALNPVSFNVQCTSGLNYSVSLDTQTGNNTFKLTDGTKEVYGIFYKDSSYSSQIERNYAFANGTGDGTVQTITIYPTLGYGAPPGNSTSATKANADAVSNPVGTYTSTITIQVSW